MREWKSFSGTQTYECREMPFPHYSCKKMLQKCILENHCKEDEKKTVSYAKKTLSVYEPANCRQIHVSLVCSGKHGKGRWEKKFSFGGPLFQARVANGLFPSRVPEVNGAVETFLHYLLLKHQHCGWRGNIAKGVCAVFTLPFGVFKGYVILYFTVVLYPRVHTCPSFYLTFFNLCLYQVLIVLIGFSLHPLPLSAAAGEDDCVSPWGKVRNKRAWGFFPFRNDRAPINDYTNAYNIKCFLPRPRVLQSINSFAKQRRLTIDGCCQRQAEEEPELNEVCFRHDAVFFAGTFP